MSGTVEGARRGAARRVGVTDEEYARRVAGGMKWCTACKEWHSRSAFVRDRSRGDGLKAKCLAADRGRPRGARDRQREVARAAVNYAVRKGVLPHPSSQPCMDCGHEGDDRRHEYDHHRGYEPEHRLSVEPVCTLCHADRERTRRNG